MEGKKERKGGEIDQESMDQWRCNKQNKPIYKMSDIEEQQIKNTYIHSTPTNRGSTGRFCRSSICIASAVSALLALNI